MALTCIISAFVTKLLPLKLSFSCLVIPWSATIIQGDWLMWFHQHPVTKEEPHRRPLLVFLQNTHQLTMKM